MDSSFLLGATVLGAVLGVFMVLYSWIKRRLIYNLPDCEPYEKKFFKKKRDQTFLIGAILFSFSMATLIMLKFPGVFTS